ncbi:MAG: tyrosine-type recombinase/integrase [Acidobacteriota bacterium]
MKQARQRFQKGSLRLVPRANHKTAWEYRYTNPATGHKDSMYLSTEEYPTRSVALDRLDSFVRELNSGHPLTALGPKTFGDLLDRFVKSERLLEIKKLRPGESNMSREDLSFTTAGSYLSVIKHIRKRWGKTQIGKVKPHLVEEWLKSLVMAPKTKGNIKALMHRLFERAMFWEVIPIGRNPMELVEVKGITKHIKKAVVLTVAQFYLILDLLPEPYRTMAQVAQCTGLRVEEILALPWENIHFDTLSMLVDRAVVHGRLQRVKTEYSEDELPLDPDFATVLLEWKRRSKGTELVFTSPATGRHFHASPAQQDYLRPAGWCLVECPQCGAAIGKRCMDTDGETPVVHEERRALAKRNKLDNVGWHTFRHTYRAWLDATGAPMGVQQKLMRHADISTTAKYGDALMESKRKHNSIVVRRALGNS